MKLVNLGDRGSITMQHSYDVVRDFDVHTVIDGFMGDAIMLNLVDLGRMRSMQPDELQDWMRDMQKSIRISFDPNVVK